jgi:hypothetical protein
MLSPKEIKQYFLGYKERVTGISYVFCLVKEEEIQKRLKSIPNKSIALVIIVPSFDSKAPDIDNITETGVLQMMLVKRIDRKDDTEDSYLTVLDAMMAKLLEIRTCMLADKATCHSIMRHLNADQIHTDPEIDFHGCFGWSMGFFMNDYNFMLQETFEPEVPGTEYRYYGPQGKSAYQVWLDLGNTGSEADFILSLKGPSGDDSTVPGPTGKSAYQVWLELGNTGSKADFILSLKGPSGDDSTVPGPTGKSAYQVWLELGNTGSEADFILSLKGPSGDDSTVPGPTGKSAYQVWLDLGNTGSEADFILSLKGPQGNTGSTGPQGPGLAESFITLTGAYTTPNNASLKQLFDVPSGGAFAAGSNKTYFFECVFSLTAMSSSSGSFSFGFGGNAVISSIAYDSIATKGSNQSNQTVVYHSWVTAATAIVITGANTATTGVCTIKGKIVIGTGGTLIPSFATSQAAAAVVGVNSFFRIWEAGSNSVQSLGSWS